LPAYKLDVAGTARITPSSGYNALFQLSSSKFRINFVNNDASANVDAAFRATSFAFQNNGGATAATLDSAGKLLLGTTTAGADGKLLVQDTGAYTVGAWNNTAVAANVGSSMLFSAGTAGNRLAAIGGYFSGAATTDGGYLTLSTRAVTSGTMTEQMRIDATGVITSPLSGLQVIAGTDVAASGTAVNFTGIPSWAKRVIVIYQGLSVNAATFIQTQIGPSTGIVTTGYIAYAGMASANTNVTTGFVAEAGGVASTWLRNGHIVLTRIDAAANQWVAGYYMGVAAGSTGYGASGGGYITLSGALDRIRVTTVNGTATFTAGSVNIFYE
jgi:hypothetical protein